MKITTRFAIFALMSVCYTRAQQTTTMAPVAASVPTTTVANFALGLGISDTQKEGISVPVPNSSTSAVQILGVQTTGDLFIESFPASIPAGGSANLTVLYYSTGSTSGGLDIIRVLTTSGQIVIPVNHGRPQAVTLSSNSLSWSIGETGTKSVTITVANGATMPMAARALGVGNSATITFLQAGSYRIDVQPGTTAQASHFPVMVDLNPVLPDVTIAINCSVGLSQG